MTQARNSDDTTLPDDIRSILGSNSFFVEFNHSSTTEYFQIALFRTQVSRRFVLKADGHPDVIAYEDGSWTPPKAIGFRISPENMGSLAEGVEYRLHPETATGDYRWESSPSLKFVRPSGNFTPSNGNAGKYTVTSAKIATSAELTCAPQRICIILTTNEDFVDFDRMQDFYANVSKDFTLEATGHPKLSAELYGITIADGTKSAFTLLLDESSSSAMKSGVAYTVKYPNPVQGNYEWIFPNNLAVTKP